MPFDQTSFFIQSVKYKSQKLHVSYFCCALYSVLRFVFMPKDCSGFYREKATPPLLSFIFCCFLGDGGSGWVGVISI